MDGTEALQLSCKAQSGYYESLLIEELDVRLDAIDTCIELGKKALAAWDEAENFSEYGKTCNWILTYLESKSQLTIDWIEGKNILEEVIVLGDNAVESLTRADDTYELAKTHYLLGVHLGYRPVEVYKSIEKQKEISQKGIEHAHKAVELSELHGDPYLIGLSIGSYGVILYDKKDDRESAEKYANRQLEIGKKINDNWILGRAYHLLAYIKIWDTVLQAEDIETIRTGYNESFRLSEQAILRFENISYLMNSVYYTLLDSLNNLVGSEIDIENKHNLIEKAIKLGRKHREKAIKSNHVFGLMIINHSLSQSLYRLSLLKKNIDEKRELLDEAVILREIQINQFKESKPHSGWDIGISYAYLSLLRNEQAKIEDSIDKKIELLKLASSEMEESIELSTLATSVILPERASSIARLRVVYCEILHRLFLATNERSHLVKAVENYRLAIQDYEKHELHVRIGEIHWKIARSYDSLGDYLKGADGFLSASECYVQAIDKMPQLKEFYLDYANYMLAWSDIENARHHHSANQYDQERDLYEKAADLHESTEKWGYLAPNYRAWAMLAEAEGLSREELTKEAHDTFRTASALFIKSKDSIEGASDSIADLDEREMAVELIDSSDLRRDYCLGRADLEEAKLLDRGGEHWASSERYGSAARFFQKIVDALGKEDERREIRPLIHLCVAWQKMTQAEAEASADLYLEASSLFDEARKHSLNEKARLLAMGHASFCRALGAGTRYEVTREAFLHQEVIRHLGSATNFYLRAGFESAVEYSKGIQRLFDAYIHMNEAGNEPDPGKKTRFYTMAETVLAASADSFSRAKHPEKRDEVERLLSSVKMERELAFSLSEILDTPSISSSTESFDVPTPSHENPVGLERFHHANVQAKMFMTSDTITSGEDFDLELELYNTGSTAASLVRVEEMIPNDFEMSRVSGYYNYSEKGLDLRGKKIGPLGTIEIGLRIKPLSKGEYVFKPRIVFLDDTGEYKSVEPEPVIITVKEMGILGWLRGSRPPK